MLGRSNDANVYNLVNNLSSIQSEFSFSVHDDFIHLPKNTDSKRPIPVDRLERLGIELCAKKYPGEYPVLICEYPLDDDLFSCFDEKVAVISTYGWTTRLSPYHVNRFIAYTLADALMGLHIETPIHYRTKGCIGDYCDDRADVNKSLERCEYCPECRSLILKGLRDRKIGLQELASIYKILDYASDRKRCLVIMPFRKQYNIVYERCLRPTIVNREDGGQTWICERADTIFKTQDIPTLVWEEILKADLIIADLTGDNPNVFFELGYAHAVNKNMILITQSLRGRDVPFYLRHMQRLEYRPTERGYEDLAKAVRNYFSDIS